MATPEQIKLMEENRRKALEKRALRQSDASKKVDQNQNTVVAGTSSKSFYSNSPSAGRSAPPAPQQQLKYPQFPNKGTSSPSTSKPYSKSPAFSSSAGGNKPVVSFQLTSRNKFYVDSPFDNEMIEIFKKFPSKTYDGVNRRWTFSLSDHQALLQSLNPLLSRFQLQPLPKFVLDIFRNVPVVKTIPEVDISSIDAKLYKGLLPFQRESIYFGVHLKGRVLIADDMGLGKTVQALALAHYYLSDWPLLIVTPSSMKYSWEEAVRVWLPSVPLHHIQVLCSGKDYIDKELAVTICSYDLLTRKAKDLEKIQYKVIIFDESHLLKSRTSQRAKAASLIGFHARRMILLSGTPALSRPEELFSQLQLLDPPRTIFGNFHSFGLRYCGGKETNFGWQYQGATNMSELQLILEEKYMIRRLKSQVLSQLPSKQRQMIVLDPTSVQCNTSTMKSMASQMGQEFSKPMEKRGALLTYYSETAKAKSKAVCDYIGDLLDGDRKFLCFAHHHTLMSDICQYIEKKKVEYIKIDGSTLADERKKMCDAFQLKDNVRVAVLSITAANTGLTLTSANLVVFAELFWNPGVLTQAEDRAHRIGQQDSVVVQYLVAKGTADDFLWPLVQSKLDILSKAGLSKDNFHEATTTNISNPKMNSIMDFMEKLSEEDLAAIEEAERSSAEPECKRVKAK